MYNPLPNYFSLHLAHDNEFLKLSETVLLNLFDSNTKVHASKTDKHAFEAKLFSNKEHKLNYLLVKKGNKITVYEEPIYSWKNKPFDYAIEELKSGSYEIHAREIISLPLTEGDELIAMARIMKKYLINIGKNNLPPDEKKEADDMFERVTSDPELDKKVMEKLGVVYGHEFSCNSNPYKLKILFEYFYKQGLISDMVPDEKWVEKNKIFNESASEEVEQLKNDINFLFDICEQHKFTNKKKYKFNDGDNFLYGHNNGMVVESQGMGAYITMKGDEIIVSAFDKENEGFLKHTTLSNLVNGLKSNEDSIIDSVILKVNKDKVEYVNVNTWYCFSSDLENTRKSIIEEKLGKMNDPIDIQSFDYQLKHAQHNLGLTKFKFLTYVFMTYSSESNYNKKLGIFNNENVTYSKKLANTSVNLNEDIPKKFDYCVPMKDIPFLQKDWLEGLEYMVDILKNHAPIPTVSNTKDKVQDVKDVVAHFEAMIPKLREKLQKKDKLKM